MKPLYSAKSFVLGLVLLLLISITGTAVVPAGQAFAAAGASANKVTNSVADAVYAADHAADGEAAAALTAAVPGGQVSVSQATYTAAEYIISGGVTSEWQAIGLAQAGYRVPESYAQSLAQKVQAAGGIFPNVTDYARIVLAVRATGGDPANFAGSGSGAGYNLLERIYNSDKISGQSLNAPVYALLALDSGSYTLPGDAKWNQTSLLSEILSKQNSDGGFALFPGASDPDMTAIVLTALSVHKNEAAVTTAGQKAVAWLAAKQDASGGYGDSSESVAQAIIALSSYGIDPTSDEFTKNEADLISRLLSFRLENGAFAHNQGGSANVLATEQGLQALVAYSLFSGGTNGKLYDFSKPAPQNPLVYVPLTIEGPEKTLGQGSTYAGNVLEALDKVAAANGLPVTNPSGNYVTGIGNISAGTYGGYDGWMYAVSRGGEWASVDVGMKDFKLKESDKLLVYYAGSDTQLVDQVALSKAQPREGETFTVTVTQKTWVWNNFTATSSPVTSSAAGVQVTIGDHTVTTDAKGIAAFTGGIPAGNYTLAVTGYAPGKAPAVAKYTQPLKIAPKNVAAYLSVEGPQGPVIDGTLEAYNALEALKKLAESGNIPLKITESSFGSYVSAINGIESGTYKGYWSFAVQRGGEWIYPSVGMGDYVLEASDRVLVYYAGADTQVVNTVQVSPAQPKPGEKFTVAVAQKQWVWNNTTFTSDPVVTPAAGVQVKIGGTAVTTNDKGIAAFDKGLPAGAYTLAVTGYVADSTPKIARYTQKLTVADPAVVPQPASATISVIGDSAKGTILPSTQVVLNPGETAYSLLKRQLGGKVEATTSGGSLYVVSIDGLKEFDRGPKSGWLYYVNGKDPGFSAADYKLSNGDMLVWSYTTDYEITSPGAGGLPGSKGTVDITTDNTLPLNQVGQTTAVTNLNARMTASEAAALSGKFTANSAAFEQEVTPGAGAALKDSGGEVQLLIPAGAVTGTVKISVRENSSSRKELVSGLYTFSPDGTKFVKPVDLSITVPVTVLNPANLALAWLDPATGRWIPVPSVLDAKTGVLTGKVSHFTDYAVVDRSKWEPKPEQLKSDIAATAKGITATEELSDWQAVGLARSGHAVPAAYLAGVKEQLSDSQGQLRKVTDYERLVLAVAAAGADPQTFGGYNLIEKIYNNDKLTSQGNNGLIFALIALDSGSYTVPSSAKWTKERLTQALLEAQDKDGGFPLTAGGTADPDITAMAVTALAAHADQAAVAAAIDKAIAWLSQQQQEDGGYKQAGEANSESTAQVIIALSAAGIGPNDSRFVKAKGGLLSHLASFRQADGGYAHTLGQPANSVATEQALLALTAYSRYLNGESKLFSISPSGVTGGAVFTDEDLISAWALDSVHQAYTRKLMEGVSGNSLIFAPKQKITRAEFAALLLRLTHNEPSSASSAPVFSDVKTGAWYYGIVLRAKQLGIVDGITATTFNPNGIISRQDMAVMIARAFKLENTASASAPQAVKFTDEARISSYALSAVRSVTQLGYMTGSGGTFDPAAAVTREMAAVVAVRLP
ncbi:S-layer homology domain-containing protein [Paenibacillus sp. P32E]|uniref:S-layer homology domain-containing protein n=1 Tax=Paenibacillus sp. P32E TaxID=1349434 RepID=UPI000938DB9E|nr:DUF4430 domain-containing protein [Paenibacillus sp. P32E]OKP94515.1 hypothetical protein A3848_00570 [Paenibacillus sp. P32E]